MMFYTFKTGKPQVRNLIVCLFKKKKRRRSQVVNYKGRAEVNKMKIKGELKKIKGLVL